MGTTAAAVALATGEPVALSGPEHYAAALTCLAEAAAPVADTEGVVGAVAVVCHGSEAGTLQLPLARLLAAQVAEHLAGEPDRQVRTLLARLRDYGDGPDWALATDGHTMLTNAAARQLDGADLRALSDLLLAGLALDEHGHRHVDLPSSGCADVELEPVLLGGLADRRGARGRARRPRRAWPRRPAGRARTWLRRRGATTPRTCAATTAPSTRRPASGPTASCSRRSCGPARRWRRASGRAGTTC